MEEERDIISDAVFEAAKGAITRGIENAMSDAAAVNSESTLEDHIKALGPLAPRAGVTPAKLRQAVSQIQSWISEINERTEEASSPEFSGRLPRESDKFDDVALRNLFAPLLTD